MSTYKQTFKKAVKTVLSLDQFGSEVNLSIKNQETHKTFIGAIASMGIAALIIFSLVGLLYDMFYTQIPTVVSNQAYDPNPQAFQLLPNEYLLAIVVADNFGSPLQQTDDATIYQPQARSCYRQQQPTKDGKVEFTSNCTYFNLIPCGEAKIDPNLVKTLKIEPSFLSVFYCINTTEWKEHSIVQQGTPASPTFKNINLRIQPCVNGRIKNQICAPEAKINASLDNCNAAIIMPNYLLNQKSEENPYMPSYKLITSILTNKQLTYLEIFLQPSNTTTIKNYFHYFGNTEKHNQLQFSRQNQYVQQIPSDGEIGSFTFLLDDQRVDYYRTYNDIFLVLANIGGLANALMFIGNLLLKPLSKLSLELFLVNKIFTFEETIENRKKSKSIVEKESLRKLRKSQSIIFLKQFKPKQPVIPIFLPDLNSNVAWLKQIFKQKFIKARFTLSEYLFQCFPGQKAKLIQTGVDKIYQKLDSVYIIKKLIEIDKLKVLLLNEQQIKLFEQLPKPSLSKEDLADHYVIRDTPNISMVDQETKTKTNRNEFDIFTRQKPFLEQLSDVFDAYQKISEFPNDLDKKLLSLLDKNILNIFDQVINLRMRSSQEMQVLDSPKDTLRGSSPVHAYSHNTKNQKIELLEKDLDSQRHTIRSYEKKRNIF